MYEFIDQVGCKSIQTLWMPIVFGGGFEKYLKLDTNNSTTTTLKSVLIFLKKNCMDKINEIVIIDNYKNKSFLNWPIWMLSSKYYSI